MASPQEIEGGEIHDFIRDVRIGSGVISELTAHHAARTAMRYAFQADFLPFAQTVAEERDSSRIVKVGIYSPLDYSNTRKTIIGNKSEAQRSRNFVNATKALFRASGVDFADADYVYVMVDLDGTDRPLHPDYADNRSRSFLQLAGWRDVEFKPVPQELVPPYDISIGLWPGDYYSMDFRPDDTTILHGIGYYGDPYSIGIYINHATV